MVSKPRTLRKLLPALGLALFAALALSGLSVASASAAAPENTVSPVISPAAPKTGVVETTTNGTWTGSPTGYAYVWFRCNASGVECKSIPGATKSTYTPVAADVGKTLLTSVTASNAEGSGVALSKPTSAVTVPPPPPAVWSACKNVGAGSGVYEDSACSKEGGTKAFSWSLIGAPTEVAMKATANFVIKLAAGGAEAEISCSTFATSGGTIENPKGSKGTISGFETINLTNCKMPKPLKSGKETCQVNEPLLLATTTSGLTEFASKPAVKFTLKTTYTSLGNKAPETCAWAGTYAISGSLTGILNNATSSLEFTEASSGLVFGPYVTTATGTNKLETKAGEALKLE